MAGGSPAHAGSPRQVAGLSAFLIDPYGKLHVCELSRRPGWDVLAQLRASVALDRPLIESSFMPHTRRIRFMNPYRQTMSGILKLKAPQGWTISPATFNFNVNPSETFDREVTLEFPYNSFAGAKKSWRSCS